MRVVSAEQATALLQDTDTLLIGGSGGGHAVPEALIAATESRYLATGTPRNLTALHPVGIGDEATQGTNRLAHPGLLQRVVTSALVDSPAIAALARADALEVYTLPQGVLSQLMREMAAGRPGLITKVGLDTFIDPRLGGGRQSLSSNQELVELISVGGEEFLRYKPFEVDIAFLRGTTADEDGNVTMEREAVFADMLPMAQATRRCGGVVIVQVERLAARGTLRPKEVKIPGILVDLVVVDPDPWQTYETKYSPAFAGELRVPMEDIPTLPLDARKVIARRAAMELAPGLVCNLGAGISTGIAAVAAEEGILEDVILTVEQGLIGGAPRSGNDAGAAINYSAMIDQAHQFDFYDGGGIDLAFLSFGQVDPAGSVNVSRLGDRIIGVGGFVNISQNARRIVFGATFTSGGLEVSWPDGRMELAREGRHRKFVSSLEQLSYNAPSGRIRGQEVLYVTERAVFRGTDAGLELVELGPGVDLHRDVIEQMDVAPLITDEVREMDPRLFRLAPMQLSGDYKARPHKAAPERLRRMSDRE